MRPRAGRWRCGNAAEHTKETKDTKKRCESSGFFRQFRFFRTSGGAMGSLLDLALRAGMVGREIATTPAERSEPGEVLVGEQAVERLLIELQPFYKWDPEELTMLRSWAR